MISARAEQWKAPKSYSIVDEVLKPAADHPPGTLTGRQLDCMLLVKEGLSSKQIARKLGISPRTVDDHVAAALETLGVASRMAAISLLFEMERAEAPPQTDRHFMLGEASNALEMHVIGSPAEMQSPAVLPPLGGAINAASRDERIAWMVRIAIFCTMFACACILTVMGISEMANGFGR